MVSMRLMCNIIGCESNTIDDDGNCKEGYLPEDCCNCDTTGNATHAFYEDNGECIRKSIIEL